MKNYKKKNWNQNFLSNMKYQSFKKRNYEFITINEELYIIGYNEKKEESFLLDLSKIKRTSKLKNEPIEKTLKYFFESDIRNYEIDKIENGWSILDSLINLRQKLNYSYDINEDSLSRNELKNLENNLSNYEKKQILKWCEEYGMPFLGNEVSSNEVQLGSRIFKYGFKNDFYTCLIENNSCLCRLGSFLIALNIIFKTFYYYLYYVDNIFILENFEFHEYNLNLQDIKSYIRRSFVSISEKAIINVDDIIEENALPHFESCAETIISLAMYQLAVVSSSKKILDAKKCSCKSCQHLFIPTRKSRFYCMNCSRGKNYKEKKNKK